MRKFLFVSALVSTLLISTPVWAAVTYTVKSGDTLSAIALNYKVTVSSVVQANQLPDANTLKIGQQLTIPTAATAPQPTAAAPQPTTAAPVQQPTKYTVKSGDSLSKIAAAYGVSMDSIIRLNQLTSPDKLSIGQVLLIPGQTTTTASRADIRTREESTAANIIAFAKEHLDCTYAYGAAGPTSFDCSGFTMYMFKEFGIDLPHSSAQQASKGVAVTKSELQPADLVFFKSSGRISHVGIYIGDGKFIHASTPADDVIITSLSESYYATRYAVARRVLP